jgi:hypothetical protein
MKKLLLILVFSLSANLLFAQEGYISGRVFDSKTNESLPGVNIIVNELEATGAATDINGLFRIKAPVGSYSIRASAIGYIPAVRTDVIVKTGREAQVVIGLSETTIELGAVTVTADYFDKSIMENELSTVILGAEEVRRSPGSAGDFQRILQVMPGVSFSNDQTNELLIRGGAPNENLTVFDNMEIHSTNHYPNQFNSAGPINMINVDLIQDIQFSTGGFISKYGDKLSGVLSVQTREGTRNSLLKSNLNISMAGYGAVMEGAIGNRGSWIVSARKSYIDVIGRSFGLTSIPNFYDIQYKVAYDLSGIHKLSLSGIYGNDKIFLEGISDFTNPAIRNSKDSTGIDIVDVRQDQYAAGISLRSIWNNDFFSIITLSKTNYQSLVDVTNSFTERTYDNEGKINSKRALSDRKVFYDKYDNGELALRSEFVWNINSSNELNFGGALKTADYKENMSIDPDTARYDINFDNVYDATVILPSSSINYNIKFFDQYKSYLYFNNKFKLFNERLILNAGLRYDYFSYSEKGNLSPRISGSYYFIPSVTSINFAYGEYYQTQSYPTYGDRYQTDVNKYLSNTHARHYVAGLEHILGEGLKINLEGYYKEYSDIPVRETFIHFDDRTFRSEKNITIGTKSTYGIDFLIQQKLVKDIYGTLSYSHMWSKFDDPRVGKEGKQFPSDYDFPDVFTLVVGKRFSGLRQQLKESPFYLKYPSYLIPFSDDMEMSVRWRYASGKVYTPLNFTTAEQHREGGIRWSKGSWQESEEINSARYPAYHRLDIGLSSRYNFNRWNLVVVLSIQNLYNRSNIAFYQYNSDGTVENVYQFSMMPVAGIELEF